MIDCTWWGSALFEIQLMRGILPMIRCFLGKHISPIVFAQDAVGPGWDHYTGAFCSAYGTPPIDQITTLACRAEVRRKVQIATVEGDSPVLIDTDVPMIHRTLLPESWFESSSKW